MRVAPSLCDKASIRWGCPASLRGHFGGATKGDAQCRPSASRSQRQPAYEDLVKSSHSLHTLKLTEIRVIGILASVILSVSDLQDWKNEAMNEIAKMPHNILSDYSLRLES